VKSERTGLVQVYTGNGKGKTTAALGLALRAAGQGLRVCMIQFMKGKADCGEHQFVKRFPAFTVLQPNDASYFGQPTQGRKAAANDALALAKDLLSSERYDILILDEALTAIWQGLISTGDVLALIRAKPREIELVLTGRGAPPEVIEAADLVTEMVLIKHPYDRGIPAREGIEY